MTRFTIGWVLIGSQLALAQPAPDPLSVPEHAPALVVDVSGLPVEPLLEELRMRLPERVLLRPRAPRPDDPIAYAIVRRDAGRIVVTLIMPGGHAYDHTLADEPGQSERVAASGLAALLDSIAAGQVEPSRTKVGLPEVDGHEAEPSAGSTDPLSSSAADPSSAPVTRPEVSAWVGPQLGLGLAPRSGASVVLGGGASAGVDLRLRGGLLASVDLRVLRRSVAGLGLWRLRFAPGVGYRWLKGALEVPLTGHLVVEPWWLRRDGEAAPLVRDARDARTPPLLGAMVRASPGVFIETSASRVHGIRVGARVEAGGSFIPDQGARTVEIGTETSDGREPQLRVGGLEVGLGLEIGLEIGAGVRVRAPER